MVTQKNTNTEKNQELKDLYPDMIMDKIKMVNDRLNQLFDILHRLIENPYRFKSADRLLEFSLKFKSKIEIPRYMSEVIFDADSKEIIRITGIEIKGSSIFFDYEVNNNDGYRYYIDFASNKLVTKEYVLFEYIFEHIDYNDFMELNDVISDIIMEIDTERKYILKVLGNKNVKMEN